VRWQSGSGDTALACRRIGHRQFSLHHSPPTLGSPSTVTAIARPAHYIPPGIDGLVLSIWSSKSACSNYETIVVVEAVGAKDIAEKASGNRLRHSEDTGLRSSLSVFAPYCDIDAVFRLMPIDRIKKRFW
jgi:hypothetical protein